LTILHGFKKMFFQQNFQRVQSYKTLSIKK
jgi:hypothetical protein